MAAPLVPIVMTATTPPTLRSGRARRGGRPGAALRGNAPRRSPLSTLLIVHESGADRKADHRPAPRPVRLRQSRRFDGPPAAAAAEVALAPGVPIPDNETCTDGPS